MSANILSAMYIQFENSKAKNIALSEMDKDIYISLTDDRTILKDVMIDPPSFSPLILNNFDSHRYQK